METLQIRKANEKDVGTILKFIKGLAEIARRKKLRKIRMERVGLEQTRNRLLQIPRCKAHERMDCFQIGRRSLEQFSWSLK